MNYSLSTVNRTKSEDLQVPTLVEEFGGVRVIIKREIFHAIQNGGRIDPKTGRLAKNGDTRNVTNDVTKNLTDRQRLIYESLPLGDIDDVTKNDTNNEKIITGLLAKKYGKDSRTIKPLPSPGTGHESRFRNTVQDPQCYHYDGVVSIYDTKGTHPCVICHFITLRYFWFLSLGLSGLVISKAPISNSGWICFLRDLDWL